MQFPYTSCAWEQKNPTLFSGTSIFVDEGSSSNVSWLLHIIVPQLWSGLATPKVSFLLKLPLSASNTIEVTACHIISF